MEQTVLQRLNRVLDRSGKTKNCFANEIGMSPTTVWRQLKGEQSVSLTLIQGFLSSFPNISAEWLLRGVGEQENSAVSKADVTMPVETATKDYDAALWQARYEELEKRYNQLIGVLGKGGV